MNSSNTDDYVVYGTAVAQLENEDLVASKPVPVHEQIVTDEKGKQRFHGAFTGGFHAGYWDTVGSLEGWTPRTFKSTRDQKGPSMAQRPEDFMDTEDLGEFGIAPKKISTTSAFTASSSTQKRTYGAAGPETNTQQLIPPLSESYGLTLLKKFGWKPGQGVGPRISKREKLLRAVRDGEVLPRTMIDAEEEDTMAKGKLFAPPDVKSVKLTPKSNFHGIGYSGLDVATGVLSSKTQSFSLFDAPDMSTSLAVPTAAAKKASQRGMTGHAFGVGAFEVDDGDIYASDDISQYDRTLDIPGQKKKDVRKPEQKSIEGVGIAKILEGFHLGAVAIHRNKVFPPPEIPRGFTGRHGAPLPTQPKPSLPVEEPKGRRHQMDANSRAAVLEKSAEPPAIKSVFDLIPAAQRGRLPVFQKSSAEVEPVATKLLTIAFESSKEAPKNAHVASVEELRRNNLPLFAAGSVTAESKMTFRPFEKDPEKQRRYEYFLQKRNERNKDAIQEVWMDVGASMTEWERDRERNEFFRAADLYRPMSGAMAARFTRETTKDETSNQVEVSEDSAKDVSKERKEAVAKKLYGRLTHDKFEWHPDKLVCKRFNVPNPYPTSSLVGLLKVKKDKISLFNFLNLPDGNPMPDANEVDAAQAPHAENQPTTSVTPDDTLKPRLIMPDLTKRSVLVKEADVEPKPVERPPMDLFRSIFQDSDVEDAAEEDDAEDVEVLPSGDVAAAEEPDIVETLIGLERSARAMEKKEYPAAPKVLVGPVRPPPEVLAAFASSARTVDVVTLSDTEEKVVDRKHKKRKHKRDSEERKKHKKHRKKKRKHSSSSTESSGDEKKRKKSVVGPMPASSSNAVEDIREESPDVDLLLFRKLKQMSSNGKRPTAADFF